MSPTFASVPPHSSNAPAPCATIPPRRDKSSGIARATTARLGLHKFRRQRPIPPYIADFYCVKLQLVIELDGDTHADRTAYDARRTQHLERDGHHVIRFLNTDVSHHLEIVLEEIFKRCQQLDGLKSTSSPQPSPGAQHRGEGAAQSRSDRHPIAFSATSTPSPPTAKSPPPPATAAPLSPHNGNEREIS